MDVPLENGANVLQVRGTDGRGTGSSLESTVVYDTTQPEPTFVSPPDGAVLNASVPDAAAAEHVPLDVA